MPTVVVYETDIRSRIEASDTLTRDQKRAFLALASYFTPEEIRELETLI